MGTTKVAIGNVPFRLHYMLTSSILVTFSLVLVFYYIFGSGRISCMEMDIRSGDYLISLCQESLSSTSRAFEITSEVAKTNKNPEKDQIYQGFYPYVWLFFLCQAAFFCVPHVVWKVIEGGKSQRLTALLGNSSLVDRDAKLKRLAGYFRDNFRTNDGYALGLFMCELLNFVNVVIQINALKWFFRGEHRAQEDQASTMVSSEAPLADLFPSSIKCTYHRYGASGLPQRHDVACVLTLNVLHAKMVAFLLAWFVVLAVISSLVLLYRLVWLCARRLRYALLVKHYRKVVSQNLLDANMQNFGIGDYYVMNVILENTHPINLQDFLSLVHGRKVDTETRSGDFIELHDRNALP